MEESIWNFISLFIVWLVVLISSFGRQQVESFLVGSSTHPLVIHGSSGCGKTSIMAMAAHRAWELHKGKAVVILRWVSLITGYIHTQIRLDVYVNVCTSEVLTRVMWLGLESDSSHYFCDLWLDLDLQRNDLRLDLDLQRNDLRLDLDLQGNDLLPTQVKSYSSDPGTS